MANAFISSFEKFSFKFLRDLAKKKLCSILEKKLYRYQVIIPFKILLTYKNYQFIFLEKKKKKG